MKKISALIAILFAAVALCAVTVNPSLDGRAVVADRGVFPSGNYGKAPGYLPGDTVIVTNHSTGFQLEVMILSTSDASEGIAILLSPEAAEKLNIVRGKDVYVKIQKKQAIPFEKVLTSSDTETGKDIAGDPDKNPSKILEDSPELLQFLKDSKTASENESPKVIEIVPEENTETPQETPVEEIAAESNDEAENADSVEAESPVLAEAIVTEDTNELIPEDIIAISEDEIPVLEETEPLPPESDDVLIETAAEEHPEIIAEVIEADEEVPVIAAEEGTEIVQEDLPVNSETAIIDPVLVEEDQESIIEEVIPEFEEEIAEETNPEFEEPVEIVQEDIPEVIEISKTDEEDPVIIVEEPSVITENSEPRNIFEEIVSGLGEEIPELLPADENPPEIVIEDATVTIIDEEVIFVEPVPAAAVTAADDVKGIEKYNTLLKTTDGLEKDKYYIQIATLREIESVDTVVASYGSKYPLSLIQVDAKYQVLVGPFTDDEYAVIYERFRQKEFKDAFIKKIK